MSEKAERGRRARRVWARPGSTHERIVTLLKWVLPVVVGVVLAFLAFAPLEDRQEVSFLLDKNKVPTAPERLRVQSAQYRGQDNQGRPFVLNARQAVQTSSTDPTVDIHDMNARLDMQNGAANLRADRARYNMDQQRVNVVGPIQVTSADGYHLTTHDVAVDLRTRTMESQTPVNGTMPLGQFSGNRMQATLGDRRVVLSGGAHVHIDQNGLRGH